MNYYWLFLAAYGIAIIVNKFPTKPTIPKMMDQTPTANLRALFSDGKHCGAKELFGVKQKSLKSSRKLPLHFCKLTVELLLKIMINTAKYKKVSYFIQFFQSNKTVCLIIHVFCKSCETT